MSDWSKTIEYINGFLGENQEISLSEIKHWISGDNNTVTIYVYVNYLHKAGFLDRTGRGIYRRIHSIPPYLTLSQLKKFTYPVGVSQENREKIIDRYWKLHNIKNKTT